MSHSGLENPAVTCLSHTLPKLRKRPSFGFFNHKIPPNSPVQSMCNNRESVARHSDGQNTPVRCPQWHPQHAFVRTVLSSYFKLKNNTSFWSCSIFFYSNPEKDEDCVGRLQWEKGISLLVTVLIHIVFFMQWTSKSSLTVPKTCPFVHVSAYCRSVPAELAGVSKPHF